MEAGVVLQGTEVKVLRQGQASIAEAYADEDEGELYLVNANIPEYSASAHFNHQPRRPRKLLLQGVMDAVISQNPGHEARAAVRVLLALARGEPILSEQEKIRIDIVMRDNLP